MGVAVGGKVRVGVRVGVKVGRGKVEVGEASGVREAM